MNRKRHIKDYGPYVVDEKNRGNICDKTESVVMDNSVSRNPAHSNKPKVSYFITENAKLLAGNNTVAVFRIKKRHAVT